MDDIDAMFSHLLGEMDHLSQSLMPAADTAEVDPDSQAERTFSIGFTDLNESLNELEDNDLDALVADLGSKSTPSEERLLTDQQTSSRTENQIAASALPQEPKPAASIPPQLNSAESSVGLQMSEPQTKADKIKLALEKLREAKVRKLIVKVLMSDGSGKTLMVDERQTVREVLDQLFEKTHCDCSIDWSLCETNPELQIERGFEDHEHLVEPLSAWTRLSENKIYFVSRPQKYVMFTEPQVFYMWKKKKECLSGINEQAKQILLKEHFGGSTLIVPDLQGMLYLKEDGKKLWKPRYFVLRASGIYYVPKGKTKSSSDLACFVRFEKVNIYTTNNFKQKYRAPSDFCFMLKSLHNMVRVVSVLSKAVLSTHGTYAICRHYTYPESHAVWIVDAFEKRERNGMEDSGTKSSRIQKESHYIKFLCCDDEHTLLLWVNSIRIAKYGTVLYENYQAAIKRTSSLQTLHFDAHKGKYNSHAPQIRPQPSPAPPKTTNVEDYPHEPPPDFIPPPPPGHTHV